MTRPTSASNHERPAGPQTEKVDTAPQLSLRVRSDKSDRANVEAWLRFYGWQAGAWIELQALHVLDGRFSSNYFAHVNDLGTVVRLIVEMEKRKPQGTYFIMNAIDPTCATRAVAGRWHLAMKNCSTSDADIVERRAILIDCDVIRPRNTSATGEQVEDADDVAGRIYDRLTEIIGSNGPIGDGATGNGAAVMIAVNIAANKEGDALIKGLLVALSHTFNTATIEIYVTVSDRKRLCPAWGSTKRKGGDGIAERPHRSTNFQCSDQSSVLMSRVSSAYARTTCRSFA